MVEFLASVIGALAAGALSKAGDIGGRAVTDAYDALRSLIVRKLGKGGAVQSLEDEPRSEAAQATLAEALTKAGLVADPELAQHAETLRAAVASVPAGGGADIEVGDISLDRSELEARRIEAGKLLQRGVRPAEVARRLKVSRTSVGRWQQMLASGGHAACVVHPARVGHPCWTRMIRNALLRR